jgi:hypothetical protein
MMITSKCLQESRCIQKYDEFIFVVHDLQGASQRLALPASGRDEIRFESRKSPKPEKCLKMPQNPTCRVHALLGNLPADQNLC